MSLPVVVWVFEHSEEKLGNRLVLLTLAEFAHDDGSEAYPSVATIGKRARLSERQVRYCLRSLEESGAIVKDGKSDLRTTKYCVQMGAISAGGKYCRGAESA
jgi:DNA-binding IclR family transcriptional regulator